MEDKNCQIQSSTGDLYFLIQGSQDSLVSAAVNQKNQRVGLLKKKDNKDLRGSQYNQSLWRLQENIAYAEFLQQNRSLFLKTREERRLMKINVLISRYVKTRSSDQCRSHHQKMLKYHRDIPSIIEFVTNLKQMKLEEEGQEINRVEEQGPALPSVSVGTVELKQIDEVPKKCQGLFDSMVQQSPFLFIQ